MFTLACNVVSEDLKSNIHLQASRVPNLFPIEEWTESQIVVTDQSEAALEYAKRNQTVVFLHPFQVSGLTRTDLASYNRVFPAFLKRNQPRIIQLKQAVESGKLGDTGLLRIHRWESQKISHPEALAEEVDLAVWLFDSTPTEIYTIKKTGYSQVHLGFTGGGMSIITVDTTVPEGSDYYSASLIGSKGAIYADDHRNMNLVLKSSGTQAIRCTQGSMAIKNFLNDLQSMLTNEENSQVDWSDILTTARICDDINDSAENADVVQLGGEHV